MQPDLISRGAFYETMGITMRRARETRGLSVENLATEMNIPISRYIEIENGHADVSMYELYCFMLYVTPNAVSDIWRK